MTTWNTDTSNVYNIFFFYWSDRVTQDRFGQHGSKTHNGFDRFSRNDRKSLFKTTITKSHVSNFRSIPTIVYLPVRFGTEICGTFSKSFAQERAALFTGKTCSCFPFEHKCAFRSYFQYKSIRLGTISTVFRNFG